MKKLTKKGIKKYIKIFLTIISIIVLIFILDIGSIYIRNKPLIIINNENCDCVDKHYRGVFYDTYYCFNENKTYIKSKNADFTCTKSTTNIVIGIITEIKENYVVIKGVSDENYLKYNLVAHIELTNNPKISGANNLIVGQQIKANIKNVKEVYPSQITTDEIIIINKEN